MKLICPTEDLSRALQTVLRSVGARAGIPALSGVLMELDDTELSLTTTDLELTTRVRLGVTGEAGRIVVPARYLSEIVRNLPSDEVEIVTEDGTVRISGGRARYSLRSLPAEDFPRTEPADETRTVTIPAGVLAQALGQVVSAASRDETRPVLTGVLFEGDASELRIVATDSYRLALRSVEVEGTDGVRMLVPARAVSEVARLAGDGDVKIDVGPAQVGFTFGSVVIWSRLIEGEFPDYRKVIPSDQSNIVQIDRTEFLDSLRRATVFAQEATHVFLEMEPDRVRLQCQAQGVGEGTDEVDASYTGEQIRVAFNPGYLEAGVSAVASDQVRIEMSEPQRPVIIRGSDEGFLYLVVPIRIN